MTAQIQQSNVPQAQTDGRDSSRRKITFHSAYGPGFCPCTMAAPVLEDAAMDSREMPEMMESAQPRLIDHRFAY